MRHHYVPQFWLRRFRDSVNQLHCRQGKALRVVSTSDVMQMEGLYLLFDSRWQCSEALESSVGRIEAVAAPLFDALDDPYVPLTDDHASHLAHFLALQACRHPDIINRAYRRGRELAELLADVHSYSKADFATRMAEFGVSAADADSQYDELKKRPPEVLLGEYEQALSLSPQDSRLPATDALRALPVIAALIEPLEMAVVHAPAAVDFILGDTPLPQSEVGRGFRVPLSRFTAVIASPRGAAKARITRRTALATEVDIINQEQWSNALHVAVGPSASLLASL